ncbi:hypothetical protein M3Y97_00953200 [Aphelenchoides bicaudatus]|nr:hypothetical protein M3Y97_00953200 [Aphelenchoides bicaudatus]
MSSLNCIALLSFLVCMLWHLAALTVTEGNNQHEGAHFADEHSRVKRQFGMPFGGGFPMMGGGFPMMGGGFPGMGGGFPGMGFGGMPFGGGGFGRRRSYMRGYQRGFQRGRWGGGRGWYG